MIEEGVKMSNEKIAIYGEIMPLPTVRGSLLPNTIASSGDDYLEIKSEIINARLGSDGEKFDSVGEHIRAVNDKIGGQPNFIANEGEDGYILNRTHYVDKEGAIHKLDNKFVDADWMATSEIIGNNDIVIAEQTLSSGLWSKGQTKLVLGMTYEVYVNDVRYLCVCYSHNDGGWYLGNGTLVGSNSTPHNNEPFCILAYSDSATSGTFYRDSNALSYPLKLKVTGHSYVVYNKLPEGFLPECVVKSVNGENPDENGNVEIEADSGLSYGEKTLLLSLFKNAVYTADVSAIITALEAVWNEDVVEKYSITNNLTDVTTSNSKASVSVGEAYSATLTPYDGMKLDAVIVTMGGVNVTNKYYDGKGNINIAVVTGDIVISASAIINGTGDWDYEWTASSGVAPVTYDGKAATGTFVDGLYKIGSDYDFAEVGPIQVEIVFRAVVHYSEQSPQFSLCYSSGNGFKVFCNNTGTVSTSIGGSNADTGTAFPADNTLQTFVGSASADGCSFEFAGLNKTGTGLIDNQWMNATRIAVSSATVYLSELRYKYL